MKYKLWNRKECPEKDQCIYENLSYVKSRLTNSWRKNRLFVNGVGTILVD